MPETMQEQPKVNTHVSQDQGTQSINPVPQVKESEDIVSRVSKLQDAPKKETQNVEETGFNFKDIDKIQDSSARKYAEEAYKSFERGFNKKFMEVASLRKDLERQLEESNRSKTWTPDRVASEMQNPSFVQAAQAYAQTVQPNPTNGQLSDEQWSALSPVEKQQMSQMQTALYNTQAQFSQMLKSQEDEKLKHSYANYEAQRIDQLQDDLISGRVQATREHLHKVVDYENAVKRAYQLGLQDRQANISEKMQATTTNGVNFTAAHDIPTREKGESSQSIFRRIFQANVDRSKRGELKT